jgi:hypothetical protein
VTGTSASQSAGPASAGSAGAASLAAGAAWAASWEAATNPAMADGSTSADVTEPTCASLPRRTTEITVVVRPRDSPLVVMELPAHRSDASDRSVTMTVVSSALPRWAASASTASTTCWGLIMRGRLLLGCSTRSRPGTGPTGSRG